MYKLVVLDVDDTTVDHNNNLSIQTYEAILKAQQKGIKVTLASGRMHQTMLNIAEKLCISLPLISCNGALIKGNKEILAQDVLEENIAKEVIEFFKKRGRILQLYTEKGLFTQEKCERTWLLEQEEGLSCSIIDEDSYNSFSKGLLKMLIRLAPEEVELYRKELEEHFGGKISAALSHKVYIEITNKGINKGRAVALLAEKLGIKQEEVLAIGDSPNDMTMLKWAGLGIAMGNAMPEVKAVADDVTLTVEENGVAKALEKYIL